MGLPPVSRVYPWSYVHSFGSTERARPDDVAIFSKIRPVWQLISKAPQPMQRVEDWRYNAHARLQTRWHFSLSKHTISHCQNTNSYHVHTHIENECVCLCVCVWERKTARARLLWVKERDTHIHADITHSHWHSHTHTPWLQRMFLPSLYRALKNYET